MRHLFTLLVLAAFVPAAFAEEIENPTYKAWALYKPGTTVTVKTVSDTAGQKSESVMVHKLLELNGEKAVVELTITSKVAGMEIVTPGGKTDHPKTIKIEGKQPLPNAKTEGVIDQGEETLKIGGKEYKTKWMTMKTKAGAIEVESKTWTSADVPGSIVKMESKTSGTVTGTSTMELVEIKVP